MSQTKSESKTESRRIFYHYYYNNLSRNEVMEKIEIPHGIEMDEYIIDEYRADGLHVVEALLESREELEKLVKFIKSSEYYDTDTLEKAKFYDTLHSDGCRTLEIIDAAHGYKIAVNEDYWQRFFVMYASGKATVIQHIAYNIAYNK